MPSPNCFLNNSTCCTISEHNDSEHSEICLVFENPLLRIWLLKCRRFVVCTALVTIVTQAVDESQRQRILIAAPHARHDATVAHRDVRWPVAAVLAVPRTVRGQLLLCEFRARDVAHGDRRAPPDAANTLSEVFLVLSLDARCVHNTARFP